MWFTGFVLLLLLFSEGFHGSSYCRKHGSFGAALAHVGFGASALLAQQIPVMLPCKFIENMNVYK